MMIAGRYAGDDMIVIWWYDCNHREDDSAVVLCGDAVQGLKVTHLKMFMIVLFMIVMFMIMIMIMIMIVLVMIVMFMIVLIITSADYSNYQPGEPLESQQ